MELNEEQIAGRKRDIGRLFDGIARRYDLLNHLLSLSADKRWRRRAVEALDVCPVLLDVATGTGDLALEALRRGRAERVDALDLSEGMVRVARLKAERAGLAHRVSFHMGSAQAMPFPSASYDAVACAFGVRNFADLDAGLSEMRRVLRPGGRLVILELSLPRRGAAAALYRPFFTRVLPAVGRAVSRDPSAYTYLRESVCRFIGSREMTRRLEALGFRSVRAERLTLGAATLYTARA